MSDLPITGESVHEPVLLHEVVAGLTRRETGDMTSVSNTSVNSVVPQIPVYLDGTLGGASHALSIAKAYDGKVAIVGLDRDPMALKRAEVKLAGKAEKVILERSNFRNLDIILQKNNIQAVDLILFDLGLSSDELENSGKGFSFLKDEPLWMTMGDPKEYSFTASDIVNDWDETVLADIIFGYSEERFARRIARAIVSYRQKKKIETSSELAQIVKMSMPAFLRRGKIHPATKTFQALRIAVNDELNSLKEGLEKGYRFLNAGGRMAVISFHSLEDRIVKDFNKKKMEEGARVFTKRPIVAGPEEVAVNPRSRSAKLRIIEKQR
ncbi:MAG: 16S rRNA (cytosine(1402)-N(4))-methyltransferase RsmH [Candidatus Paceibacterota bacterium]|jgi:16S rRNA (cytosine1402-N4)-methyltransferase